MKNTVMFLTHSNILTDARILKTINAVKQLPRLEVYGYGLEDNFEKHIGSYVNNQVTNIDIKIPVFFRLIRIQQVNQYKGNSLNYYLN